MKTRLRIAYLSHLDTNLYLFRLSWMKALVRNGHEVIAIVPKGKSFERFEKHGVRAVEYSIERGGLNPFSAACTLVQLFSILKRERPDILHTFTIEPNIFGSIAGRCTGVPMIINHVTGLGFAYTEKGAAGFMRRLSSALYFVSFRIAKKVVFQNADDLEELRGLVPVGKADLIKGTGVDASYFDRTRLECDSVEALRKELGIRPGAIVVTMIGRLLRHKGIGEFVEAARTLSLRHEHLTFLVVGWRDEANPSVVNQEFINEAQTGGRILFTGEREDIREILGMTDIYVLPSYREGTPRTVLEAMAMSLPVITTDAPGCRQTVEDGVSGLLVPVKDAVALANAIEKLMGSAALRRRMGEAGREKVIREFSDEVVIGRIMDLYERILARDMPRLAAGGG